tara:strand:+ start:1165 stop:1611 length:447 start_codon:yes stop_codon:yes gene_type:complete
MKKGNTITDALDIMVTQYEDMSVPNTNLDSYTPAKAIVGNFIRGREAALKSALKVRSGPASQIKYLVSDEVWTGDEIQDTKLLQLQEFVKKIDQQMQLIEEHKQEAMQYFFQKFGVAYTPYVPKPINVANVKKQTAAYKEALKLVANA